MSARAIPDCEPLFSVGEAVIVQPGKWANNRRPNRAKILTRWWGEEGIWVYAIETVSGKR